MFLLLTQAGDDDRASPCYSGLAYGMTRCFTPAELQRLFAANLHTVHTEPGGMDHGI